MGGSPYPSVGRDPCVPPHNMHVFLPAGHAGPALQGTGRVQADRVVRPYSGSRSRAKRDVEDAVPYGRFAVSIRRAGPMCPAARYACFPSGGARGPRPTGHRPYPGGQGRPPLRRRTVCTSSRRPCNTWIFSPDEAGKRSHTFCMASFPNKVWRKKTRITGPTCSRSPKL